ncbi:hypothetical protein F3Y22_tig00112443pilonHSYRG00154 [Hibiscus syriacus]|uniref:RING-type E3 ubiquitin transferase n=1 Tax=Hibiscus syriacus TaxID=106335 RepID=A0A6A2XJ63_HIBSY|nr:hypothetical protein F3Y22_tig00112443pilonHSYRG00154 [Hibiscus syriacus]
MDAMRDRFSHLIQGNILVFEYKVEFLKLSRYAPELVSSEYHHCRKFKEGLWLDILTLLAFNPLKIFAELVLQEKTIERVVAKKSEFAIIFFEIARSSECSSNLTQQSTPTIQRGGRFQRGESSSIQVDRGAVQSRVSGEPRVATRQYAIRAQEEEEEEKTAYEISGNLTLYPIPPAPPSVQYSGSRLPHCPRKIRGARTPRLRLRFLLEEDSSASARNLCRSRGAVDVIPVADGRSLISLKNNALVSQESGDEAVIIQRTQLIFTMNGEACLDGLLIRAILGDLGIKRVNFDENTLEFVLFSVLMFCSYKCLADTFLQALFGHEYPVGLLDEEKILLVGKEISRRHMQLNNGAPEIKACKDLPFFLKAKLSLGIIASISTFSDTSESYVDLTKDQMLLDLAFKTKILFRSGIVLGTGIMEREESETDSGIN